MFRKPIFDDLYDLLDFIWLNKSIILISTVCGALVVVSLSFLIPNQYESSAILQIREKGSSQPDIGNLGGIASLAGISLPSSSSNDGEYILETLKSKALLREVLNEGKVRANLFAASSYDFEKGKLKYKKKVYDDSTDKWVRKVDDNQKITPSYIEIHDHKSYKKLKISRDKASNFIEISFEHPSPFFAKEFIDILVFLANSKIKNKDLKDATSALKYLEDELQKTTLEEIRFSISKLIEENTNTIMLANIYEDYILIPIEPSFVPEEKSSPSRFLILVISLIASFLISLFFIIIREILKQNQARK